MYIRKGIIKMTANKINMNTKVFTEDMVWENEWVDENKLYTVLSYITKDNDKRTLKIKNEDALKAFLFDDDACYKKFEHFFFESYRYYNFKNKEKYLPFVPGNTFVIFTMNFDSFCAKMKFKVVEVNETEIILDFYQEDGYNSEIYCSPDGFFIPRKMKNVISVFTAAHRMGTNSIKDIVTYINYQTEFTYF